MAKWLTTAILIGFLFLSFGPIWAQDQPQTPNPGAGVGVQTFVGAPSDLVAASGSGIATKYWLRFMADSTPTLWLYVGGSWRQMDNPSDAVQDSVQEAFCGCTNPFEVYVSYSDGKISWVVVRTP